MSNDKLAVLNDGAMKNLNATLEELVASGDVKLAELQPSLSALLSDPLQGGFPGRLFIGSVAGFRAAVPMPSFDDKDDLQDVDVLELKDVSGNFLGQSFNFYARNGGSKAKISAVKDHEFVLICYKGEVPSDDKHHNPYKDYLVMGFKRKDTALAAANKIEKAIGISSATGGAKLAGAAK